MSLIHEYDVTSDYNYVFKTVIRSLTFMSLHKVHVKIKKYIRARRIKYFQNILLIFYYPLRRMI